MAEILQREFIYLWYYCEVQFQQIALYWVVGMVIGSLISVFLKQRIFRLFQSFSHRQLGWLGLIPASLLGAASPLCMYGTLPIAATFAESGMEEDWLAAFMMTSILLNPQLIVYSAALGNKVLELRIVSCLLCGICAGLCIRFFFRDQHFFNFSGMQEPENHDTDPHILLRFLKNLWRNFKATAPLFFLGILLSALFQRYVPQNFMGNLFGKERGFGILLAATIGVPLYVCGGGTIPLLQSWLAEGMSLGAAAAFMITGPATKITNLGALKIVLGTKHFFEYMAWVILFALLTGFLINLF